MPSSQNDPIILNNSRLDIFLTSIKDADRDAVLDYAPRLSGNGSPRGRWRVARGRGEFPGLSVAERRFPLLVRRIVNGHVFLLYSGAGPTTRRRTGQAPHISEATLLEICYSLVARLGEIMQELRIPLIRCDRQSS